MKRNIPLLTTTSLIAGILAGVFFRPTWEWSVAILGMGILIGTFLLLNDRTPSATWKYRKSGYLWLFLSISGLGLMTEFIRRPTFPDIRENEETHLVGNVKDVINRAEGDNLIVDVISLQKDGKENSERVNELKVRIFTDEPGYEPGDIISFSGSLVPYGGDENPFRLRTPKILRYGSGIKYRISVPEGRIRLIGHEEDLMTLSKGIRYRIESCIEKCSLNPETKGFIIAVLLGDKNYLEQDRLNSLADAGVSHFIAVSGMHIGIFALIILTLLLPLNLLGKFKWRYPIAVIVIWGYVLLCGFSYSSIRAAIMLSFAFTAIMTERLVNSINTFLWAIFFILLFLPYSIFDIGFQLSVVCVGALILYVERLNLIDQRRHNQLFKANGLILTAIVTSLASWVLISYYFQRIPLLFLPANILALPFLPVYFFMATVYLLIAGITGIEIGIFRFVLEKSYLLFTNLTDTISAMDYGVLEFAIGGFSVLLWLAVLIAGGSAINFHKRKYIVTTFVLTVIFMISLPLCANPLPGDGFVILSSYPQIKMREYSGGREKDMTIPGTVNKEVRINEKRLLILDSEYNESIGSDYDIILIAGGWHGNPEDIKELCNNVTVVLHPTIRKKRENLLIDVLEKNRIKVFSLRKQGDFEI
ncbi:MAG: ComEC family competence protein [Muribaculaceae bacterium]|nr:ComEC family competence protein [Muribaculaceae bacterium]